MVPVDPDCFHFSSLTVDAIHPFSWGPFPSHICLLFSGLSFLQFNIFLVGSKTSTCLFGFKVLSSNPSGETEEQNNKHREIQSFKKSHAFLESLSLAYFVCCCDIYDSRRHIRLQLSSLVLCTVTISLRCISFNLKTLFSTRHLLPSKEGEIPGRNAEMKPVYSGVHWNQTCACM